MTATPQYGTAIARGLTGNQYAVDLYVSDVANAPVRFDGGAGAGSASADFYSFPEAVIITDICLASTTVDTTKIRITANGAPTPNILRNHSHVATLSNRPQLSLKLRAGTRLGGIQL